MDIESSKSSSSSIETCADLKDILKILCDEYNKLAFDVPKAQQSLIKTYLWMSQIITSSAVAGYFYLINANNVKNGMSLLFYFSLLIMMFIFSIATMLSVDTLRGRNNRRLVMGKYPDIIKLLMYHNNNNSRGDFYVEVSEIIHSNIEKSIEEASFTGKRLRYLSICIAQGFIFLLTAYVPLIFFAKNYNIIWFVVFFIAQGIYLSIAFKKNDISKVHS